MGVDVDVDDVDDNIIPGCYAFNIDVEGLELSKIWIRADYIRVYNSLDSLRDVTTASIFQRIGAILTGEPGIGKSVWCVMRYADALQEGSQSSGIYFSLVICFLKKASMKLLQVSSLLPYIGLR